MHPAPFLLGLGVGAGLIFGIASLGGMFAVRDKLRSRARRRRILRAAAKCRACDYAGSWTQVAVHEALNHDATGRGGANDA